MQPEWALFLGLVPESYEDHPSDSPAWVNFSTPCNQSEGCGHQVHLCMSENISCPGYCLKVKCIGAQPHHTVG